nr:MAG TPA: hypothetical protein [Caudoviricetes sp.]
MDFFFCQNYFFVFLYFFTIVIIFNIFCFKCFFNFCVISYCFFK